MDEMLAHFRESALDLTMIRPTKRPAFPTLRGAAAADFEKPAKDLLIAAFGCVPRRER